MTVAHDAPTTRKTACVFWTHTTLSAAHATQEFECSCAEALLPIHSQCKQGQCQLSILLNIVMMWAPPNPKSSISENCGQKPTNARSGCSKLHTSDPTNLKPKYPLAPWVPGCEGPRLCSSVPVCLVSGAESKCIWSLKVKCRKRLRLKSWSYSLRL